jgi:hypothetical protein
MKIFNLLSVLMTLVCATTFAATGNLQNRDFATPATILGAGGSLSQLLHTTNVYDPVSGLQLSVLRDISNWFGNSRQAA